jgi:hypothetical protein
MIQELREHNRDAVIEFFRDFYDYKTGLPLNI